MWQKRLTPQRTRSACVGRALRMQLRRVEGNLLAVWRLQRHAPLLERRRRRPSPRLGRVEATRLPSWIEEEEAARLGGKSERARDLPGKAGGRRCPLG